LGHLGAGLAEPVEEDVAAVIGAGDLDAAAFTSSLTVDHFLAAAADRGVEEAARAGLGDAVVGAIGPPTAETAADRGVDVDVVPDAASFESLAAAVVDAAGKASTAASGDGPR
ncbi:uroporphyrinogen-III synthase, partial [Halorubrum ezzemoulense]|uniref:uroporphyrinogen-III synthase n=1 Tax=Halorubrum ezzemoulense TaxID=337243 RepID=UPI00211B2BBB